MDKIDKRKKKDFDRNLRPGGAYLDSLTDFADLLGTIKQAEDAAIELLDETSSLTGNKSPHTPYQTNLINSPIDNAPTPPGNSDSSGSNANDKEAERSTHADLVTDAKDAEKVPTLEELLENLDALVGLESIKQSVKSLINLVKIRKLREENQLPNPPLSLHMVFTGNPGTGKTTVARILSELYRVIGVLSKGQLIEVDRSGLVAGFVGQTALKTSEAVTSALGGILFIDEAYALAPEVGNSNDFGREAIETLLKLMEDHRDDLIVIVAGYNEPMERFILSNPGLESRFNRYFAFDDYNGEQLYEIFDSMCLKSEYILTDDAKTFAIEHFHMLYLVRDENFGNARHVRNFFENVVSVHSDRISALEGHTREDLTTVTLEDMEKASQQ